MATPVTAMTGVAAMTGVGVSPACPVAMTGQRGHGGADDR
jgi:hypothetical protein